MLNCGLHGVTILFLTILQLKTFRKKATQNTFRSCPFPAIHDRRVGIPLLFQMPRFLFGWGYWKASGFSVNCSISQGMTSSRLFVASSLVSGNVGSSLPKQSIIDRRPCACLPAWPRGASQRVPYLTAACITNDRFEVLRHGSGAGSVGARWWVAHVGSRFHFCLIGKTSS